MGLVEHIHPFLVELDYRNPFTKLKCIGLSSVFFCVLFILSGAISSTLSKTYRSLTQKKKAFWNIYVVHGIFGIFCFVIGAWTLFYDTELLKHPGISTNSTSCFAALLSTGFFLFECGALLVFDLHKNTSTLLSVHHWASLFGFCLITYHDIVHYFGLTFLFISISAPFSGICWILLKCGKGQTVLWKVNQFLLVHVFHIRTMVGYFVCYQAYQKFELLVATLSPYLVFILISQLALFHLVMTPYWLYRRTQQMFVPVDFNFVEGIDAKKEVNGSYKKDS